MLIQKIKAAAWRIFMLLYSRGLKQPSALEQAQIEQLRHVFLTLPDADETVSSEAEKVWHQNLNRLKTKILHEDPRRFLSWDVVRETMFVGNASYVKVELNYLKNHREWQGRWQKAIQEEEQGCPPPYYSYMKSSGNLIHHAYHLARFENKTGLRIDKFHTIFEFGGGYGSMCRLVHKLGFQGKYVIFDLPHFSHLQRYYLKSLGLNVKSKGQAGEGSGIYCVDTIGDLEQAQVGGEGSLFIATWSFSETPIHVRSQVIPQIRLCQSQLIAYQDVFGEVDNVDYFANQPEFNVFPQSMNEKIQHLSGSRYLFGWE